MKKSIQLTEHIILPLVLACLNIVVVHLIYLFSIQGFAIGSYKILVASSLVLLVGGIIYKNKWLLLGSIVYYIAVFLIA